MSEVNDATLALIKLYEGFSPDVYICAAGYPTIGYGHMVREGENFSDGITQVWAEQLLRADVRVAERAVQRHITAPLTENQYGALVSFTYNLGGGALQRSTLRRVVNREGHADVPPQFMRWVYGRGRKLKGLVRRRAAEAELYALS